MWLHEWNEIQIGMLEITSQHSKCKLQFLKNFILLFIDAFDLGTIYIVFKGDFVFFQPTFQVVDCLRLIEELCTESILPFLKSYGFQTVLSHLWYLFIEHLFMYNFQQDMSHSVSEYWAHFFLFFSFVKVLSPRTIFTSLHIYFTDI